jgi:amino acid transporter
MMIIVFSALASLQTSSGQSNQLYAYLRILGLVFGFLIVAYGVYRLRFERDDSDRTDAGS